MMNWMSCNCSMKMMTTRCSKMTNSIPIRCCCLSWTTPSKTTMRMMSRCWTMSLTKMSWIPKRYSTMTMNFPNTNSNCCLSRTMSNLTMTTSLNCSRCNWMSWTTSRCLTNSMTIPILTRTKTNWMTIPKRYCCCLNSKRIPTKTMTNSTMNLNNSKNSNCC